MRIKKIVRLPKNESLPAYLTNAVIGQIKSCPKRSFDYAPPSATPQGESELIESFLSAAGHD
jgi:hypothetical protein